MAGIEQTGYINPEVAKMYGKKYSQLSAKEKKILHADSVRRAKLIQERENDVLNNNRKAFEDEAKMERVLGQIYKTCQQEIITSVTETIAKVKKSGGTWSYANQSALTRARGLFEQIDEQIKALGQKESIIFTKGLSNIYTDQFLRELYGLGQVKNVKANFNKLNPTMIQHTLDYPWSGAMFSDRLWNDKATLGRNLRIGLTQSMILGEGIPQITDRINKNIDNTRFNAERVARTETKRVSYVAQRDIWEDNKVKELKYRCGNGGDSRTCKFCFGDNEQVFKIGEEPTLPRHPNCRCTYIPVVKDTFDDNELNELTGSIRGAENYEKWRATQETDDKSPVTEQEKMVTPSKTAAKKVNIGEELRLTDYPNQFYAKKAEAESTQALLDYINSRTDANKDVVKIYKTMDKLYTANDESRFKISHAKKHSLRVDSRSGVTLTVPKVTGSGDLGEINTNLHEQMHFLDYLCRENNRKWISHELSDTFKKQSSSIGAPIKELFNQHKKEYDKIIKEMTDKQYDEHSKLIAKYIPNGVWAVGADYQGYLTAYNALKRDIDKEKDHKCRNIMGGGIGNLQDIYDALSGGKYRDNYTVTYGHGTSCYKDYNSRVEETLANYGALSVTRPDLIKMLAEDKPELVIGLENVIKKMIEKAGV